MLELDVFVFWPFSGLLLEWVHGFSAVLFIGRMIIVLLLELFQYNYIARKSQELLLGETLTFPICNAE